MEKIIQEIKKGSPWYDYRDHLKGQSFNKEGDRYYPTSTKAVEFCKSQGVEYIVFISGAIFLS